MPKGTVTLKVELHDVVLGCRACMHRFIIRGPFERCSALLWREAHLDPYIITARMVPHATPQRPTL